MASLPCSLACAAESGRFHEPLSDWDDSRNRPDFGSARRFYDAATASIRSAEGFSP
jgi:hypothetical protein